MNHNKINYKLFIILIVISIFLVFACFNLMQFAFKKYTKHDHVIYVPSLSGLDLGACQDTLLSIGLNWVVLDSTAYNPNYIRGGVIMHSPKPGSAVKPGRKVYLTINPLKVDYIKFPNLKDKSFRQAMAILENTAFRVGDLFYLDDFARNVVKFSYYNNIRINAGDSFPKFSLIDLHLGNGFEQTVEVPDLTGLIYGNLKQKLNNNSLNIGSCYFINNITDTLNAVVYDFKPSHPEYVTLGSRISVWLTDSIVGTNSK
jgi:beta-lactam-binding protein with PASTA domain